MTERRDETYEGFRRVRARLVESDLHSMGLHSSEAEIPTFYAYHALDKAYLVMLAEANLVPRGDAARMLSALREMEEQGIEKVRLQVGGGMHSGEQYLIRKLGEEVGGRIHLARGSADLMEYGTRAKLRDDSLEVMGEVNQLRGALLDTAAQHADTVMPGYTHGQHAQPITLGYQLLGWASCLERDFDRLEAAYHRINQNPTGIGMLAGSSFPVDRGRLAELLGCEGTCVSPFDAVLNHDYLLEAVSVLGILYSNLARWADDIILWSTSEFGMVEIPDRFCSGSSIMMQKKNPHALELMRGAASNAVGAIMGAFMADKGFTGLTIIERFYSKNATWFMLNNLLRDLGLMAALVPAMKVNPELMKERAAAFWAQATEIAGALVREKGLPWRTAYQVVGVLVRLSYERGLKPDEVDTRLLDAAAIEYLGRPIDLDEGSLRRALDPLEFVKARAFHGGPAPLAVLARIPELSERLGRDRQIVGGMREQLEAAHDKLERAVDAIIRTAGT